MNFNFSFSKDKNKIFSPTKYIIVVDKFSRYTPCNIYAEERHGYDIVE